MTRTILLTNRASGMTMHCLFEWGAKVSLVNAPKEKARILNRTGPFLYDASVKEQSAIHQGSTCAISSDTGSVRLA